MPDAKARSLVWAPVGKKLRPAIVLEERPGGDLLVIPGTSTASRFPPVVAVPANSRYGRGLGLPNDTCCRGCAECEVVPPSSVTVTAKVCPPVVHRPQVAFEQAAVERMLKPTRISESRRRACNLSVPPAAGEQDP